MPSCFSLLAVIAALCAMCNGLSAADYSALYIAPGFLSKATTLAAPHMLKQLQSYVHQNVTTCIPTATQCIISHDTLAVLNVSLDSVSVVPQPDGRTLLVTVDGLTNLETTVAQFTVRCSYGGAFRGTAELPQAGSVSFVVTFPHPLSYVVDLVVDAANGSVSLGSPNMIGTVQATPTYVYSSQGFSLDLFVGSYFESTLAGIIMDEINTLLSFPRQFASTWLALANDALSVAQFVCGTDMPLPYSSIALWMRPACSSDPTLNATWSVLATSDVLVFLPSTQQKRSLKRLSTAPFDGPAAPNTCVSAPACDFEVRLSTLRMSLSNCTVCYPGSGRYTELGATATFSFA